MRVGTIIGLGAVGLLGWFVVRPLWKLRQFMGCLQAAGVINLPAGSKQQFAAALACGREHGVPEHIVREALTRANAEMAGGAGKPLPTVVWDVAKTAMPCYEAKIQEGLARSRSYKPTPAQAAQFLLDCARQSGAPETEVQRWLAPKAAQGFGFKGWYQGV